MRYQNYYHSYRIPKSAPSARPTIRYTQTQIKRGGGLGRQTSSYQIRQGAGAQRLGGKISAKSAYGRGTIRYGG